MSGTGNDDFLPEDLRTLVDAIDVGIALQRRDGAIIAANPAAGRLLGLSHDQLLGRDSMDPRWAARRDDGTDFPGEEHPAMVALRTGRDQHDVTMQISRPDGTRVWLSVSARAMFHDDEPGPSHVAVTFRDVTETRRAVREQDRYRDAFESVGVGTVVISIDPPGRIVTCNAAFAELLGREVDDLIGLHVDDLTHPADVRLSTEASVALFAGQQRSVRLEQRSLRGDGSYVWLLAHATLVRNTQGDPVYAISQSIDITERKVAEEKLNTYMAQISDVVMVVDAMATVRYVTESVRGAMGYAPAELIGVNAFDYVHPDDREQAIVSLTNTAKRPGSAPPLLLRLRNAQGEHVHMELAATNKLSDPSIRGVVIAARDISERIRIEQALREREREFERLAARQEHERLELELARAQRLESLGRLVGGIAHDFNNLLGVIMNYTTLLERRSDLETQVRSDVDAIARAAERGAELVRQLLLFSRRDGAEHQEIVVDEVVAELVRLLGRTLGSRVELVVHAEPELTVEGDRGQLEQLVINLVLNARDAIPDRGRILIEARAVDGGDAVVRERSPGVGDCVLVSVIDDGVGMDADVARRAFEPFFTTKPAGEGSGLGLSSVYGIVERLGGRVWIESEIGAGTAVHVLVPRSIADEPDITAAGSVLVVDDEPEVREMVRRLLADGGWTVRVADDRASALALVHQEPDLDLVLTDHRMPGGSGLDLASDLRALRPELPVVLMSGFVAEHQLLDAAAVVDVIAKPFTGDELVRVLRRHVRA